MTTSTIHDLLAGANVRDDDAPGTAAALLWGRIADTYGLRAESPVAKLGVLDRVVLVLLDVAQLAIWEVAELLNTDAETVIAAHESARARIGLPPSDTPTCSRWDLVRAAHRIGDPDTVDELIAHLESCEDCGTAAEEHSSVRRWWARRVAAVSAPSMGGVFTVIPAFAAALAAAAAITAGVLAVREATNPAPTLEDLPVPVVVDDAPGLPSDQEPSDGWPELDSPVLDGTGQGGLEDGPVEDDDLLEDTVEDVTGTLDDVVGDVPDTVEDVVGDVTDTLDDVVGDVTDTLDELSDPVTGETDAVTDVIPDTGDLLP